MKMKKLLAIVLVLCMAVGLAACAVNSRLDNQSNNQKRSAEHQRFHRQ